MITHPHRRHKGLGREQVAELAGISGDWYGRLEGGLATNPSRETLWALTRALQFTAIETRFVFELAGFAEPRDEPSDALREEVLTYLLGDPLQVGLYVMDAYLTPLRWNAIADALWEFSRAGTPAERNFMCRLDEPHVVSLLGSSYEGAVAGLVGIFRRSHTLQPTPFSHQILEIALQAPIVRRFWDEHVVAEQVWPASGPYPRWHPTVGVVWINSLSLSLAPIRGEVLVALAPADPSSAKEFARLRAIGKALQSSPDRRSLDPN